MKAKATIDSNKHIVRSIAASRKNKSDTTADTIQQTTIAFTKKRYWTTSKEHNKHESKRMKEKPKRKRLEKDTTCMVDEGNFQHRWPSWSKAADLRSASQTRAWVRTPFGAYFYSFTALSYCFHVVETIFKMS